MVERLDHLDNLTAWIWTPPKERPRRFPTPFRYPRPIPETKRRTSSNEEILRFFRKG